MTDHGYSVVKDPYCYEGSSVLKNKLNLRDQKLLDSAERQLTGLRFEEALPIGTFNVAHYCAIHHHLFQDLFVWAGEFRTVRISKGASVFCYPEYIRRETTTLYDKLQIGILQPRLDRHTFANRAADFLAELNAIHPFREGNGRTQLAFLTVLTEYKGHPLDLKLFNPNRLLAAMISSFNGSTADLAAEILGEEK